MANMNIIAISGRLGAKPELKTAKSGNEYCEFSVACSRWNPSEKNEVTDWFRCVCFGSRAVYLSKYADKGSFVAVYGAMESSKGKDDKTYWKLRANDVDVAKSGAAAPSYGERPSAELTDVDMDDGALPF